MNMKPVLGSQIQLGHPLSKGLIGYWVMNEGSGTIIRDVSGNGNTGTITSAPWVAGKFGSALSFNGSPTKVSTPLTYSGNEITYACWFNATNLKGSNRDCIVGTGWLTRVGHVFLVQRSTSEGLIYFGIGRADSSGASSYSIPGFAVGRWYFIVTTVNVNTSPVCTLYLDGKKVHSSKSPVGETISCTHTIGIGYGYDLSYFSGLIDNVMIYNRALTDQEIASLYTDPYQMFRSRHLPLWVGATSVGEAPPVATGYMTLNTGFWGP